MPHKQSRIKLSHKGLPVFSIEQPRNAGSPEEFAAEELRRHLLKICGVGPQLRNDIKSRRDDVVCRISINDPDAAQAAGIKTDRLNLSPEAFHLETRANNLYLLGGGPRGVLYGVYDLLETLGCRWFTPEISHLPHDPELSIPRLKRTDAPDFEFRDAWAWDNHDPLWWLRNRMNGWYTPVPDCWGGHMDYGMFVHTFYTLVPPKKYFDSHPEYFSLINGRRSVGRSQLCLSNPNVLRIVTQNVLKCMRDNPQARLFSVSQNDWHGYCECPECRRIAEAEGSQSGPMLRFVNAVARETVKHFPDNLIDTLAYQYTLDAPKHVRPHKNVRVRLCPICCCQGHAYGQCDHPESKRFLRALNAWSKITSNIYIWHYCTNFAHYPLPMADFDELNANLKLYKKKGVYGVFMQGMGEEGGGGESMALRTYVLSKLMWNADQPVWPIVRKFLRGVCGPAADGVETYMQAFHSRVRKDKNLHPSLYDPPDHPLFDAPTLASAEKGLSAARRAARTPHAKLYVDMLKNGIDYARLWQKGKAFRRRGNAYASDGKPSDVRRFKAMKKTWQTAGVLRLQEARPMESSLLALEQRITPRKLEFLRDKTQSIVVLPGHGGRLLEWRMAGRDWLMPGQGYRESFSDADNQSAGEANVYRVIRATDKSVSMKADFKGVRMTRRYTLSSGRLRIVSAMLNRSEQTRRPQWNLGIHLQPPTGMLKKARMTFTTTNGESVELSVSDMPDRLKNASVFEDKRLPAGELSILFAKSICWTWTFNTEIVDRVILGRDMEKGMLALDLRILSTDIKPGATLAFKQSLAVKSSNG